MNLPKLSRKAVFVILTIFLFATTFSASRVVAATPSYTESLAAVLYSVENLVAAISNLLAVSPNASPTGASNANSSAQTLPPQASTVAQDRLGGGATSGVGNSS